MGPGSSINALKQNTYIYIFLSNHPSRKPTKIWGRALAGNITCKLTFNKGSFFGCRPCFPCSYTQGQRDCHKMEDCVCKKKGKKKKKERKRWQVNEPPLLDSAGTTKVGCWQTYWSNSDATVCVNGLYSENHKRRTSQQMHHPTPEELWWWQHQTVCLSFKFF